MHIYKSTNCIETWFTLLIVACLIFNFILKWHIIIPFIYQIGLQNHSREVVFAPIALLLPQHYIPFISIVHSHCFVFVFLLILTFLRKPSVCRKPLLKALWALHKHEKNNQSVKEEEKWTWVRSHKWNKTITILIHKSFVFF